MKTVRLLWLSFTFVTAVVTWPAAASPTAAWPTTRQTTESPGLNLNGKMLTLSKYGGVSFSRPHYHPPIATTSRPYHTSTRPYHTSTRPYHTSTRPYHTTSRPYHTSTRPYHTSTRPYHTSTGPWTTAPLTGGVSVCLRYLADSVSLLFTLSPSRSPLTFSGSDSVYGLSFPRYSYNPLYLRPKIPFWANPAPDIWTRVCFTVDSGLQVAQVFSGSNLSIRKMLPAGENYVWSGEPVIDFPGFDGQLTDVQVWDYPLSYKEVFNYMMGGIYLPYRGSALSWSYISYSPRGRTLLEDNYELQARRPISSLLRKHRPKGGRKAGRFSNGGKREREPL
ncbi:uncharacterized protein ACO6RY_09151 [Pungitius sinensis]